ncbi:MAG: zf-HC2 domain-containing protein [bacterium]
MRCTDVKRGNFVERYVADELSEKERELFEEHYFACPKCLEELATMQQIGGGVKELAEAGEIAYKPEAVKESILQRLARLGEFIPDPVAWRYLKPAFYVLSALVLLMIYPTWRGLFLTPTPRVNVSYFSLDVARGVTRIDVPPYSEAIVLEFSVAAEEKYERYDVEMTDYRGTVIWKEKDLKRLGDFGTFAISFDRDFLREGDYVLTVYGFKENKSTPIERFPFQIVKTPER